MLLVSNCILYDLLLLIKEFFIVYLQVYSHQVGEVWFLHWSPHDASMFCSTYSYIDDVCNILNKCSIWRLPLSGQDLEEIAHINDYDNVKVRYLQFII